MKHEPMLTDFPLRRISGGDWDQTKLRHPSVAASESFSEVGRISNHPCAFSHISSAQLALISDLTNPNTETENGLIDNNNNLITTPRQTAGD